MCGANPSFQPSAKIANRAITAPDKSTVAKGRDGVLKERSQVVQTPVVWVAISNQSRDFSKDIGAFGKLAKRAAPRLYFAGFHIGHTAMVQYECDLWAVINQLAGPDQLMRQNAQIKCETCSCQSFNIITKSIWL